MLEFKLKTIPVSCFVLALKPAERSWNTTIFTTNDTLKRVTFQRKKILVRTELSTRHSKVETIDL